MLKVRFGLVLVSIDSFRHRQEQLWKAFDDAFALMPEPAWYREGAGQGCPDMRFGPRTLQQLREKAVHEWPCNYGLAFSDAPQDAGPAYEVQATWCRSGGPFYDALHLYLPLEALRDEGLGERLADLLKEWCVELGAWYAYGNVVARYWFPGGQEGRTRHELRELLRHRPMVDIVNDNFTLSGKPCVKGAFWLNYLGPHHLLALGWEGKPPADLGCYRAEVLDDGGLFLQLTENLPDEDSEDDLGRYAALAEALAPVWATELPYPPDLPQHMLGHIDWQGWHYRWIPERRPGVGGAVGWVLGREHFSWRHAKPLSETEEESLDAEPAEEEEAGEE